jgi:hypothetical protein
MAETGINFDPEPEVAQVEEVKENKKDKKKKVEEIDPEVLEQRRLAELKKQDIAHYGVSNVYQVTFKVYLRLGRLRAGRRSHH